MADYEFWDEYEFNFFMDLDDEDKLLYIYDLMIGDFQDEYLGETEIDFEFEEDDIRTDVLAIFDRAGYVSITGQSKELLIKVANNMMMNGVILSDKSVSELEDGEWLVQYKIIGNAPPVSLN